LKGLLVGYGSIGRRHLTNFHDLGVTDWAIVHTGQGTLPLEPPCPVRTYDDLDTALRQDRPDFAVVANPTSLHVATACACIDAGCPVLLEKPVAHNGDGVDELRRLQAARGVDVLVGFQMRFHSALIRIGELLTSGALGTPLDARVVWSEHLPAAHPWEDFRQGYAARADLGGGAHHSLCHPFDYLRMLLGEPQSLTASLRRNGPLGLDVAESADVTLHFPNHVVAQVHLDHWGQPPVHRLEISCTDGAVHWDWLSGDYRVWNVADSAWRAETLAGADERNDLFVAEAAHFLDVVAGRAQPACTLDDGIRAVEITAAIERSDASGEVVPTS
jgi:predicted dehydrogenase